MPVPLEGKPALITAAGQAICRATALLAYARQAAEVFAIDVNTDILNVLTRQADGRLSIFELDILDQNSIGKNVARANSDILLTGLPTFIATPWFEESSHAV